MSFSTRQQPVLISVVIPFHGHAPWLLQALQSLLNQSFHAWEALLVSDHATPDVLHSVDKLQRSDPRIRLLIPPPRTGGPDGPWYARNFAIDHANGSWLAFLDSDDVWHPCKLERQIQLSESSQSPLITTAYYRFRASDHIVLETRIPPTHIRLSHLLFHNPIPLSSALVSISILDKVRFRPLYHEDYDFWLQLYSQNPSIIGYSCIDVLTAYRLHPDSLSSHRLNGLLAVYQIYKNFNPLSAIPLIRTLFWLLFHCVSAVKRLSLLPIRASHRLPTVFSISPPQSTTTNSPDSSIRKL